MRWTRIEDAVALASMCDIMNKKKGPTNVMCVAKPAGARASASEMPPGSGIRSKSVQLQMNGSRAMPGTAGIPWPKEVLLNQSLSPEHLRSYHGIFIKVGM